MSGAALIIGGGGIITPAPPTAPDDRVIVGVTLTSAGGTVDLIGDTYRLGNPSVGLTGPDNALDLRDLPGFDGGYVPGLDTDRAGLDLDAAYLVLSVKVTTRDALDTSNAIHELRRVLASRRYGPALLTVTRRDGHTRTLTVHHVPNADDFAPPPGGSHRRRVLLRLTAPMPLWRGTSGQAGPWYIDTGGGGEYPLDYAIDYASSSVVGQANPVLVDGDEITYPVITSVGPFGAVQVERHLDGRDRGYTLTAPGDGAEAGQVVTIRHAPRAVLGGVQVEGPDGSSWRRHLSPAPDLFELRPGAQAITVQLDDGGPGANVGVTWETLHWSCV